MAFAVLVVAMLAFAAPLCTAGEDQNYSGGVVLSADPIGSGTQSDPYQINMLAGDTFEYKMATNIAASFSTTSGDLSIVGLALSGDTISGTAKYGSQKVCVTASATIGPTQSATQWIQFNVYHVLTISATTEPSWAGQDYSATITINDINPASSGETNLTLNSEATNAGFTLTKNSETSWTLSRPAASNVAGTVNVVLTASGSAGGIAQSKNLSKTVVTYDNVGIPSTPGNHVGNEYQVWLIEGNGTWTYTPTATPEGATISVSTPLPTSITWSSGTLTVDKSKPLDEQTVTFTATSSAGGTTETATQTITIQVWNRIDYETQPTVTNITGTVDGRSYSASVVANNYNKIIWDMGDGTTYEDVTSVNHTYADKTGMYTVRVTVYDDRGQSASTNTAVYIVSSEDIPKPDNPDDPNGGNGSDSNGTTITVGALIMIIVGIVLLVIGFFAPIPLQAKLILIIAGVIVLVIGVLWQLNAVDWLTDALNNLFDKKWEF